LTFLTGFIVAKLLKFPKKTVKKEKGIKIKKAKNTKELLETLVLCDKALFTQEIESLEAAVYKGEKVELVQLKKSALKKL